MRHAFRSFMISLPMTITNAIVNTNVIHHPKLIVATSLPKTDDQHDNCKDPQQRYNGPIPKILHSFHPPFGFCHHCSSLNVQ